MITGIALVVLLLICSLSTYALIRVRLSSIPLPWTLDRETRRLLDEAIEKSRALLDEIDPDMETIATLRGKRYGDLDPEQQAAVFLYVKQVLVFQACDGIGIAAAMLQGRDHESAQATLRGACFLLDTVLSIEPDEIRHDYTVGDEPPGLSPARIQ